MKTSKQWKELFKNAENNGDYENMIIGLIMYEKLYDEEEAKEVYDKVMESSWACGIFDINAVIDEMEGE